MRWHTLFPAEQRSPSLLSFVSLCRRRPAISSVLSAITFYGTALLCSLLNFPSLFLAYGFRMPLWTSTSYYFLALLSAGFCRFLLFHPCEPRIGSLYRTLHLGYCITSCSMLYWMLV